VVQSEDAKRGEDAGVILKGCSTVLLSETTLVAQVVTFFEKGSPQLNACEMVVEAYEGNGVNGNNLMDKASCLLHF
jgi:hypothetical protein